MKYKLLLLGVIAIVLVMSGCISSLNMGAKGSASPGPAPLFSAVRTNATTISIMLIDLDGAKAVTGLHVQSPSIGSPDVIPDGTAVPVGKEIKVTDPNLAGKVNFIVTSSVDGKSQEVLNDTVSA